MLVIPSSAIVNWLEAFDGGGKTAHPMKEDPMKEDVKKKHFPPPLGKTRVW
jgi:hypothetical protein